MTLALALALSMAPLAQGAPDDNSNPTPAAAAAESDPRLAPATEWQPGDEGDPRLAPATEWKPAAEGDPRLAPATEWQPEESAGDASGGSAGGSTWAPLPQSAGPIKLRWGGAVQSEVHYRPWAKEVGGYYDRRVLRDGFVRNENTLRLALTARVGDFSGVADVDFDWVTLMDAPSELTAMTYPERVSPYRLEAHALYLEAANLFVDGLDLRVGQQVVQWGVGDQFNPTNTLNANDLENTLFFGRQLANLMARADYAFAGAWSVSGVFVPIFKPAVLPASAPLGMAGVDRLPFLSEKLRWKLHSEREAGAGQGYPTVVSSIEPELPRPTIDNAQWAVRLAGSLLDQDVALSYYAGRTDVPVPVRNVVTQSHEPVCNEDGSECTDGLLLTDVTVRYPRVQVVGLNLAGEVDPFGWISRSVMPIGYRVEVGLYLPEEQRFSVEQRNVELLGQQRDGEYPYGLRGGKRPRVLDDTPFAKWVLGLDYSFGRHVYANLMWVHGMVDEFGAGDFIHEGYSVRRGGVSEGSRVLDCAAGGDLGRDPAECAAETLRPRLGDYAVVGLDLRFADGQGLLRLFTVWDLSGVEVEAWDRRQKQRVRTRYTFYDEEAFSAVLFPQLEYNFGDGLVLAAGALLQLGEDYTKFGDPAAGGSLVWTRATFAY